MSPYHDVPHENPPLYLSHETAALFWRAVHEKRLPMPKLVKPSEAASAKNETLPLHPNALTGLRAVRNIDLSPVGLTMTDQGAIAHYRRRKVDWGVLYERCPTWMQVPMGIALPPGTVAPLHVLTSRPSQRCKHRAIRTHLMKRPLPARSLYRISNSLYVVSPELCFIQSCLTRRMLPNVELGLEWCGRYALMPGDLPLMTDATPVMSVESLSTYLASCERRRGAAMAKRVMTWLADAVASPRETELYLLLTLPTSLGGFGLPKPMVNVGVGMGQPHVKARKDSVAYEVDLKWVVKGGKIVVVEYDGFDEHEGSPAKSLRDKERRSLLAALGHTVIVITKQHLASLDRLHAKVAQICLALDMDAPQFKTQEEREAHEALFNWLCNPSHDHLPFGYCYR